MTLEKTITFVKILTVTLKFKITLLSSHWSVKTQLYTIMVSEENCI